MKIMTIAVHPDDETLGCGASLLKYKQHGSDLSWVIITAAMEPEFTREQSSRQVSQVESVSKAYGFKWIRWLKYPSTRLESVPHAELISSIGKAIAEAKPDVIYVPHRGDVHSDHREAWNAIQACTKPASLSVESNLRILACETLSETEAAPAFPDSAFLPNVIVDVSETLDRKIEIMKLYRTEIQAEPLPRSPSSIRALARYRGAMMCAQYAEAFMLIREIIR